MESNSKVWPGRPKNSDVDARRSVIASLIAQGADRADMAAITGYSKHMIQSAVDCFGVNVPRVPTKGHRNAKGRRPVYDAGEIARLAGEGLSVREIAYKVGCSPDTVYGVASRHKITLKGRRVTEDDIARMAQMVCDGYSNLAISKELGWSETVVSKYTRNIQRPSRRESVQIADETGLGPRIIDMLSRGMSHKQISRELGCNDSLPSYYSAKMRGIPAQSSQYKKGWKARTLEQNRANMIEFLKGSQCADCGIRDILVLEFDHIRGKDANVSKLLDGNTWKRILTEIEKCEVVCANCHRRRTHTRQGNYRARAIGKP